MTNLLYTLIWTTNWIMIPGHSLTMDGTNYSHAYRVVQVQTNQQEVVMEPKTNTISFGKMFQVCSNTVPEWIPSVTPQQIPPLPVLPVWPWLNDTNVRYLNVPNVQVKQ